MAGDDLPVLVPDDSTSRALSFGVTTLGCGWAVMRVMLRRVAILLAVDGIHASVNDSTEEIGLVFDRAVHHSVLIRAARRARFEAFARYVAEEAKTR